MKKDLYGCFLSDYYYSKLKSDVLLHNNYGEVEELPVESFFRTEDDMPDLEIFALNLCKGKILDIGAGVGVHSLLLQKNGFDVTAIELSEGACEIMKTQGVKNIIWGDVTRYKEEKYDTLLLLMNGIGFCGYISDLKIFLQQAKEMIKPEGQILFDSSDVAYLYEENEPESDSYYGEIDYQYEYNGEKGDWFSWLYLDQKTMQEIAFECGWHLQIIYEDEDEQYLGRLILK
ncbi:MAG: methyltransferase domain-containing protein [Sphingobacteriales bacterium]|nr:methyltransferase domain-containing protein [Sphingobacteriales bacterium]